MDKYYYVSVALNMNTGLHSIMSNVIKKHPFVWVKERHLELSDTVTDFHSVTIIAWQEISEAEYTSFPKIEEE